MAIKHEHWSRKIRSHNSVRIEMKWSEFFKNQLHIGIATTIPFLGSTILAIFIKDELSISYGKMKKPCWAPPGKVTPWTFSKLKLNSVVSDFWSRLDGFILFDWLRKLPCLVCWRKVLWFDFVPFHFIFIDSFDKLVFRDLPCDAHGIHDDSRSDAFSICNTDNNSVLSRWQTSWFNVDPSHFLDCPFICSTLPNVDHEPRWRMVCQSWKYFHQNFSECFCKQLNY